MQADGFLARRERHPFGMTMAVAINGAALAALMLAKGPAIPLPPTVLKLIPIHMPEPPPEPNPPPPAPRDMAKPPEQVTAIKPIVPSQSEPTRFVLPDRPLVTPGDGGITPGFDVKPPTIPLPVLKDAYPDPRFAADLQPPYPPGKQRLGEEGKVVVRVLIGTDGRVKKVERVSGADEAFLVATERQALRRWRFKPATRDGVPVEGWKAMTVRFEITG